MLLFDNVSKSFFTGDRMRPILSEASFAAGDDGNFGLVAPERAGRTTITNLIVGAEQPDSGRVRRFGRISWPVGGVSGLIQPLSGAENCRYIAMIYGLDPEEVLAFAIDLARIGRYIDMPVKTYSSTLKQRLALALLLAIDFDMYLVVEGAKTGDEVFGERARPILNEKLRRTPVFFIAGNTGRMRQLCRRVAVLHDCRIHVFDSAEEAAAFQEREMAPHV